MNVAVGQADGPYETIRTSQARQFPRASFTHGNDIRLFRSGSRLFPRMLEVIRNARETVNLEVYIFRDDSIGRKFVQALADTARRGVTVRFILDAWGSFTFSREFLDRLERAGVKVIRYRPFSPFTGRWGWRRRDHRKLLTVDEQYGFIGGMNIGVEYLNRQDGGTGIRDTHLEVRGPVIRQIKDLFSYNWNNHYHARDEYFTSALEERTSSECTCRGREICARITGGRWKEKNAIHHEYLEKIQEARREIRLTQAYFLPTEDVVQALGEASNRGCRVQLLLPGVSDVPPVQYGSRYLYSRLLENGIKIYEYMDSILHAKTAVIDTRWATVGTYNFDYQSLFHNLEVNITVEGKPFARKMSRLFERDLEDSRQITEGDVHNWRTYEKALALFWHGCRWLL